MKPFIGIEKIAGIEIQIRSDGVININGCLLEKQKNVISVIESFSGLQSYEELKEVFPKHCSAVLLISGKGIINKLNDDLINLNAILSGSDQKDFFIQYTKSEAIQKIISFARKTTVESIVKQLENESIYVQKVFLGQFIIADFITTTQVHIAFPLYYDSYQLNDTLKWEIPLTEKLNVSFSYADKINVGEEQLDINVLPAFSAAFLTLMDANLSWLTQGDEQILELKKEYFQKKVFKVLGYGMLVLFFTILLGNFFVFDEMRKDNIELKGKLAKNRTIVNNLESLKEDISNKKRLINVNGLNGETRLSFYTDHILDKMPDGIILTSMNVNPRKIKKDGIETEILFDNNTITINGNTTESIALNEWIKSLKLYAWIKDVVIDKYKIPNDEGRADFNLTVSLK